MDAHPGGRALGLGRHGDAPAVIDADGTVLTHAELAQLVASRATSWRPGRRLVLVEGGNTLSSLVAHLTALEHGHVSLLVPPCSADLDGPIASTYDPDVVCSSTGDLVRRSSSAHDLHPDLALLSSTSGTTGSPKLVRLSVDNVRSNAESIATYLGLGHGDRALTSLPLHYCYGLSVVHSHLAAGGAVVLTSASVVDDAFWIAAREHAVTSFAGVPHTFELLEGLDLAPRWPRSLRQVTQAGGRMAPERVVAWAERGAREGWDLFVMYGQTEATARMAYLPPDLTCVHPSSIGVPVPGGRLRVDPVPESDDPEVGELVYSGPNVMMGYATSPADLARGPELDELRTGDLGRVRNGLFEVVGRRNRIAKVFGLRIDLPAVEADLESRGTPAELAATDRHLHAFLTTPSEDGAADVRRTVAELCHVPPHAVRVHRLAALPRTTNGKVDRGALTRLAVLDSAAVEAEGPPDHGATAAPDPAGLEQWVVETAARVLGRAEATVDDSFVGLGGDSLSYVEMAVHLERRLGDLPAGWHTLSFADLAAGATPSAPCSPARPSSDPRAGEVEQAAHLDTSITLRAVAILAIVASHVDLMDLKGGAHLLLALAGYNFARFQLGSTHRSTRVRHGVATLAQLVLPAVLWVGVVATWPGGYDLTTTLLLNNLLGPDTWDVRWQLWFLEALVWILLGAVALMAVPLAHRWERRGPYAFALGVLGVAALARWALVGVEAGTVERYSTGVVAVFFALGWVAARADTTARRVTVTLLAALLVAGFFGDPVREATVVAGMTLFTWAPRLRVPRRVAPALGRVVGVLATYSFFVYLTHWVVYPPLEDAGHRWLALGASFAVGITYGVAVRPLQRWVAARITRPAGDRGTVPTALPPRPQAASPRPEPLVAPPG